MHQADEPEEQKCDGDGVPHEHHDGRVGLWQRQRADGKRADEAAGGGEKTHYGDDAQYDDVCESAASQLVAANSPLEPDERSDVLPVQGAVSSSHRSFCCASGSAPAFSRKRSSSEPPRRIASSESCSTNSPLTMMPTCVHSFSTTSRTCDVKNTVEPRAT